MHKQQKNLAAGCLVQYLAIRGDKNLDVPEVPLFRVKIHKNVNFSDLAYRWLLKLQKLSVSSTTCAQMQEFES